MLITTQKLPMASNDGIPWGGIVIAIIIIGGVSYLSYQAFKPMPALNSSKTNENERG